LVWYCSGKGGDKNFGLIEALVPIGKLVLKHQFFGTLVPKNVGNPILFILL
jgi:hypothetical protein